jgi:hypothetical protein
VGKRINELQEIQDQIPKLLYIKFMEKLLAYEKDVKAYYLMELIYRDLAKLCKEGRIMRKKVISSDNITQFDETMKKPIHLKMKLKLFVSTRLPKAERLKIQ